MGPTVNHMSRHADDPHDWVIVSAAYPAFAA